MSKITYVGILTLLIFLLSGCGKVWYNYQPKTKNQFEMDKARCMAFANGAYGSQMPYPTTQTQTKQYNFSGYTTNGTQYYGTVTQKPTYQQNVADLGNAMGNLAYTINKERAFDACMINLNYYLKN